MARHKGFKLGDIDKGYEKLRTLLQNIKQRKDHVRVGVFGSQDNTRPGELLGNVELAAIHEFGTQDGVVPERSFIRSTFDANRQAYHAQLRVLLQRVYELKTDPRQVLALMGERIAADMKRRITTGSGIPPPLKPATIRRKGSTRPLVDTGRLLDSITYEVVEGVE